MDRGRTLHTSWRSTVVAPTPTHTWEVVASGEHGPQWYLDSAPLRLRGAVDRLVPGPAARGHPPPGRALLRAGDRVGFWEVLTADHRRHELVLHAHVRTPGAVRLRTTVAPAAERTRVRIAVSFEPTGVLGRCYLLTDIPAREAVVEMTLRYLVTALRSAPG